MCNGLMPERMWNIILGTLREISMANGRVERSETGVGERG